MLNRIFSFAEDDPVGRSLGQLLRRWRNRLVVVAVVLALAWAVGIPHLQTTFEYTGQKTADGWTPTEQKMTAWYFSITGFQHVKKGQYGHNGCPVILFIPLEDCIDLSWLKQRLTFPLIQE